MVITLKRYKRYVFSFVWYYEKNFQIYMVHLQVIHFFVFFPKVHFMRRILNETCLSSQNDVVSTAAPMSGVMQFYSVTTTIIIY